MPTTSVLTRGQFTSFQNRRKNADLNQDEPECLLLAKRQRPRRE